MVLFGSFPRLKNRRYRAQGPGLDEFGDAARERRDAVAAAQHRREVVVQDAALRLVLELLGLDPVEVRLRPVLLPGKAPAVAQEELRELVTCRALGLDCVLARALEIAHRLGRAVGDVDGREIPGPEKTR